MTDSPATASTCPLCGNDNQCAIAGGRPVEDCWCWSATIDAQARTKAAATANERCLCPACGAPTGERRIEG